MFKYKNENSLEKRKENFRNIKENHPNEIPIICEKSKDSKINKIIKTRYLLKEEFKFAYFMKLIKAKLELKEDEALFFFIDGKYSLTGQETIKEVYNRYKSDDGFLYVLYGEEKFFG
jgi:hypothetical protein